MKPLVLSKSSRKPTLNTSKESTQTMRLDKQIVGESLHTALRKCCDSPITSAAWHLLYAMPRNVWADYIDQVFEGIIVQQEHPSQGMIASAVRRVSLEDFDPYKYDGDARSLAWTLKLIFQ